MRYTLDIQDKGFSLLFVLHQISNCYIFFYASSNYMLVLLVCWRWRSLSFPLTNLRHNHHLLIPPTQPSPAASIDSPRRLAIADLPDLKGTGNCIILRASEIKARSPLWSPCDCAYRKMPVPSLWGGDGRWSAARTVTPHWPAASTPDGHKTAYCEIPLSECIHCSTTARC